MNINKVSLEVVLSSILTPHSLKLVNSFETGLNQMFVFSVVYIRNFNQLFVSLMRV